MWAISWTARSNASALAWEGLVEPLTLRTYCSAAAWISSWLAEGSKLWSVRMFRHMSESYDVAMSMQAAFMRGLNVGGHRLTNAELSSHFEAMELERVGVFRASGNVVFDAPDEPPEELTARIEAGLEAALGYAVATFLRPDGQMRSLAAEEPFDAATLEASMGKLQVLFLREHPSPQTRKAVLALAGDDDALAFSGGNELFWLPSGGTLDSELDFKAVDRYVGTWTARTKGTVDRMATKFFA